MKITPEDIEDQVDRHSKVKVMGCIHVTFRVALVFDYLEDDYIVTLFGRTVTPSEDNGWSAWVEKKKTVVHTQYEAAEIFNEYYEIGTKDFLSSYGKGSL